MGRRPSPQSLGAALAVLVLVSAIIAPLPAMAKPLFQSPFPCGETWYMSSYPDHGPNGWAIDFHATSWGSSPAGRTVVASNAGMVTVGDQGDTLNTLGYYVVVRDGSYATLYGHLQRGSAASLAGKWVEAGTPIGIVGTTGANNIHLHYAQLSTGFNDIPAEFNGSLVSYPLPGYSAGRPLTSQNCGAQPPPPAPDADGDGVADTNDRCPSVAGPALLRGCPFTLAWGARAGGDFNGDGKDDVAALYEYGGANTGLWLFRGTKGGFRDPDLRWLSGAGEWGWDRTMPA